MNCVEQCYDSNPEHEWAREDRHRTEFAVTRRILTEFLPPTPAKLLDIGGGVGRYSIWLAEKGYSVTLADLSAISLDFARGKADEAGVEIERLVHADATNLTGVPDASCDAALLMGPLYHLIEAEERRAAVCETMRTLKPGSPIFAAFISRYSPVRSIAKLDPMALLETEEESGWLLDAGVYRKPENGAWADAYFAHPTEVVPFMESCGPETLDLIGCEGVVSLNEEKINELTGEAWEAWVDLNVRLGRDPCLHGAVEHLLYVGRKNQAEGRDGHG